MKTLWLANGTLACCFQSPTSSTKGFRKSLFISAKKSDSSENQTIRTPLPWKLEVANPLLARAVVAVFGLGFIDAGYSGDWSRIGVISKEIEEFLKLFALLIVPLCIATMLIITNDEDN